MKPALIISTFPNKKILLEISQILFNEKLIACMNFLKTDSIFYWNKKIEKNSEYIVFFKTTTDKKKLLKKKILEFHPYEVPEIADIQISSVNKLYMKWLIDSTI